MANCAVAPPQSFFARLESVPPFPPIATRLLGMLGREGVGLEDVAELILSDPMFTGCVLRHANSAEFALASPITNVRQALASLGQDRTREITLTAATAVYAQAAPRTAEMKRCWRHTVAAALLSQEISRACGAFTESAYAAGLLHDIGRLALLVAYRGEYEATIRDCAARCLDLLDFEKERFGADHAEAGRWLGERWGLPPDFIVIAGRHHDPSDGAELSLLKIVHVGCRLADYFGYDVTRPLTPPDLNQILAELPERARERLSADTDRLAKKIEAAIEGFGENEAAEAARPASPPEEPNVSAETSTTPMTARSGGFMEWLREAIFSLLPWNRTRLK